jgi:CheY-like chemotaxis protein/HPt (histidine-containing phosphotransfer) domain-containing protein
MNAITGMGRQLLKTQLNSQQQFYVDTINTASANLLVIIDDILDLSKIESGRLTLYNKAFSIKGIIDKALFMVSQKASEKGISVTKKVDAELANVLFGDPQRVGQVIDNLLSNAVKFTEKGGIALECTVLQDKDNKQVVQVSVRDTGAGMSKEFLKIIFNKFTQEDEGAVRKYGGTGLGMSISKHLIEAMGGKISVESEKGIGTTVHFIVTLEKGTQADLTTLNFADSPENILKDVSVLLVEDNEMNRMVANTVLIQYGAIVEEALNGLEAVNMLKKKLYDVVLMDVRMPVMDGIEAARVIREKISPTIPIIALTANVVKGEKEKCMNAGMNEFIGKPFDENNLIETIAKLAKKTIAPKPTIEIKAEKVKEEIQKPTALYDLSKLWDISRGKQAFVEKMINIFVTETGNAIKDMRVAFENSDIEKIRSLAHKIKPSLYNLSINLIREEIINLEMFGKNEGPAGDIKALVEKVESVLTTVIAQMKNDPIINPGQ